MMTAVVFIMLISFSLPQKTIAATSFVKGIDVSTFQGTIDWNSVVNSGIDFAIIRCATTKIADPTYIEDSKFSQNYSGAKSAGIKVGTYMYTSAASKSEMKSNIEAMLSTIGSRKFDLPVYLDVEQAERQSKLGKTELTEILLYGCNLIESSGHKAGVYANYDWFKNYVNADILRSAGYEIWLARYPSGTYAVNPSDYDFSDSCTTWQYSSLGKISGISGNVDLDIRYSMSEPNFNDYDYELDIPYPRPQCNSTHWLGDGTVGSVTGIKKGREVGWLQTALNRAINAGLDVDCEIGPKTTAAIKNFQSKYGLTADGYAGEKTINKLVELLRKPIELGIPQLSTISVKKPTSLEKGVVDISWYSLKNATNYLLKVGFTTISGEQIIEVGDSTNYIFTYSREFIEENGELEMWVQVIALNEEYGLQAESEGIYIMLEIDDVPDVPITTLTSVTEKSATIKWNAVSGATGYRIDFRKSGDEYTQIESNYSGTSYTKTGLAPGTQYYFRVYAVNSAGTSAKPETVGAKTLNTVTIHYNVNGGTLASDSEYYTETNGDIYKTSSNAIVAPVWPENFKHENGLYNASTFKLSRTGHTFLGWSTTKSGGTVYGQSDNTISANTLYPEITSKCGTITLYAQWKENPVTTTSKITTTATQTTTCTTKVTTTIATTVSKLSVNESEINMSIKEQYAIKANQTDLTYKSNNTDVAIVSKNGIITAVGNGETIILVSNSSGDAVKIKVKVISLIKGDANNDGKVTVADAIMLQEWLLGAGDLNNWQNADICEDGKIDVFDMVEMRKLLIKNNSLSAQ